MNLENYLSERIDPQIKWYDKKSSSYKFYFFLGNIMILVISSLIPFLTSFESSDYKYIIGFMGVLITITTGILNLSGFYQKWLLYRTTSEKLKSEKFMLNLLMDKLDDQEKLEYVQRFESIINDENTNWLEQSKSKNTPSKNK
jgi:hypothetical protein